MNADHRLCGRITDHPTHSWQGLGDNFDHEGFLRRVQFQCPGHVVIEGGQRRHHTCTEETP